MSAHRRCSVESFAAFVESSCDAWRQQTLGHADLLQATRRSNFPLCWGIFLEPNPHIQNKTINKNMAEKCRFSPIFEVPLAIVCQVFFSLFCLVRGGWVTSSFDSLAQS